ncbi:hypothetical protein DSBG_4390 [Desulfosporosinus sp. BG]|nr:hypothetical protein [Desulfosporosinus sp. BG]ODA38836.1 hypothetical protein DSBG_4390 [Desulfosporosinus sp. BG]
MTIRDWCEKNGVSKNQYNYWNQRVRKSQKTGKETTFVDITPIISPVDTESQNPVVTSDFQIFFNSFQVRVPFNFSPNSLAELMKVLREL